jgi:GNAT superfamily N-acetyltransferase
MGKSLCFFRNDYKNDYKMNYIIRSVETTDLTKIVDLCAKHADYEQATYDPNGKELLLKKAIFATNPTLYCAVIEVNEQIEGYFSYTFDFSTWDAQRFLYLDCLFLEPEIRGLGIGTSVFEYLKKIAKQQNCINIQWQTPIFNERAIKFYNRIGGIEKDKKRFFIAV